MNWEAIFTFLLNWGAGFAVGWWAASKVMQRAFQHILEKGEVTDAQLHKAADELGFDIDEFFEGVEEPTTHLRIEQHSNSFCAYNVETNQFLTQADTAKELVDNIIKLSPQGHYNIAPEDGLELVQKELDKMTEPS